MPRRIPSRSTDRVPTSVHRIAPPNRTYVRTYGLTKTDGPVDDLLTRRTAYARTPNRPCRHQNEHGEATIWPADAELDHFDYCLTEAERLDWWRGTAGMIDNARRCWLSDHVGRIAELERLSRTAAPEAVAGYAFTLPAISRDQLEHTPDLLSVIRAEMES